MSWSPASLYEWQRNPASFVQNQLLDTFSNNSLFFSDTSKKRWNIKATVSPELESLEKVLHFPEEVALALAEAESQLFSQVKRFSLKSFLCNLFAIFQVIASFSSLFFLHAIKTLFFKEWANIFTCFSFLFRSVITGGSAWVSSPCYNGRWWIRASVRGLESASWSHCSHWSIQRGETRNFVENSTE